MSTARTFDVAIVGMGPVGAAAAILFAEAGLDVVVFEKTEAIYPLPRAVGMDGEIVRAFQRIGRGEELNALLQPKRPGDRAGFANSRREWLFGQDWVDFGRNGWQPISMFDQPELERYLRDTLAELANVRVLLGHEVVSFTDDGTKVRLSTPAETVEARYLVACDGASSPVRKALGIGWHDLGYDHDWLVVDVTVKDGHTLANDTLQVCDPDRITTYVATKDPFRRWEFKLNPGETWAEMLEPETIHALLDPWTPRGTYEIRRSAVYQFHAATADRWRVGRVLLAGDAAHQTPPFLGQGMNAGMRDVVNLAWKLELVLGGIAKDTLLDSYAAERKPHAEDLVEWAVAVGQLMEHLAAVEKAERADKPPPELPSQKRSAGYGQGREAPPLRDGVILKEQVSDEGSTAYLFSQPIVRDGTGASFRLDQRLGRGFALVGRSDAAVALDSASVAVAEALGMAIVSLEGLEPVRGRFDALFEHADAAVVRPDRYVFGHTTDRLGANDLVRSLAERLSLTEHLALA